MGDSNVPLQFLQAEDEVVTLQNSDSRENSTISIPICFLVKEQAKSVSAIQELQKRVSKVENVQDDVVDAIIKIKNYLSDSKIYNSLNLATTPSSFNATRSPNLNVSKAASLKDHILSPNRVPESSDHVQCNGLIYDFQSTLIPHESDKHLDSKNKDSALESDKQDSGLDSDCREHHDLHLSKQPNLLNPETNDELLQLLDEISYRSTLLQHQLASAENPQLAGPVFKGPTALNDYSFSNHTNSKADQNKIPAIELCSNPKPLSKSYSEDSQRAETNEVPFTPQMLSNDLHKLYKQIDGSQARFLRPTGFRVRRRGLNGIDSTTVSSILKETSVVDLQRYALVHLVDNAVLHTRLREAEQSFASKRVESEKVENKLKEEARQLMMENRELRITLDEFRMENNSVKSKMVVLDRILQSLTNENQELNWQLEESLNQSKSRLQNFSQSYSCANSGSTTKSARRSSLPSQLSCHNDAYISCMKSKLLSNASSFLDITVEDGEEDPPVIVRPTASVLKSHILASTPMPSKIQSDNLLNAGDRTTDSFSFAKKNLKFNKFSDKKNILNKQRYSLKNDPLEGRGAKPFTLPHYLNKDTIQLDADGKFPFNTILEKLNSEYKLNGNTTVSKGGNFNVSAPDFMMSPDSAMQRQDIHSNELQLRKKGRNVHQRIQNILDRIVAEPNEAS